MLIAVIFKAAFLEKEKRLLMQFILGHEWYHCNCCFVFCIFCPLQTKSRIKRGQEKKVLWFWKWSWSMLRACFYYMWKIAVESASVLHLLHVQKGLSFRMGSVTSFQSSPCNKCDSRG